MRNPHGKHAADYDADYDNAARYKAARRAHTDTHPVVGYATYCTPNCASNCPGHFTDDGTHITVTLSNQHRRETRL